jgi:hypothetical protein
MKKQLRALALVLTLTVSAALATLAAAPAMADAPHSASTSVTVPRSIPSGQSSDDASGSHSSAVPVTLTMIAGIFVLGGSIGLVLASGNRRRNVYH